MKQVSWKLNKAYKIVKYIYIPAIIAAVYYVSTNWYQVALIHGDSMSPAYHNMQLVLLERHSDLYTYGDVISFRCENLNAVLIKRIVACPGDQVIIENGTLYVNGAVSRIFPQEGIFKYSGVDNVNLGENQYFVIGDNIGESKDSRYKEIGAVNGTDILGKIQL